MAAKTKYLVMAVETITCVLKISCHFKDSVSTEDYFIIKITNIILFHLLTFDYKMPPT